MNNPARWYKTEDGVLAGEPGEGILGTFWNLSFWPLTNNWSQSQMVKAVRLFLFSLFGFT